MFKSILKNFKINNNNSVSSIICRIKEEKRYKSTKHDWLNHKSGHTKLDLSFEKNAVLSVFPQIHDEIINEQLIYHKSNSDLKERYSKLLHYNLSLDPKYLSRAIIFVHAYRLLEKPSHLTDDNLKKACVLGWCHKFIDASIIIDDDIADESHIRYNKPTWYTLNNVGVDKAILDAAFLETGAYFLILNHFKTHPQYFNIQKEFLKSYASTNVAQVVEVRKHKLEELEKYQDFVKFYFFTVPLISSALYLANIDDTEAHYVAEELCKDIARFQKIEDDVICVFSPMSDTQKVCTDISEGRASWLAIEAYKRGSHAHRKILEKHFGKNKKESVIQVYNVFKDLRLKEAFDDFKESFYQNMHSKIYNDLPKKLPPEIFINLLDYAMSGEYRI